ncbi:hypothetical protein TrRE_jg12172 [Triparma retinervis]|uniref:Uncharacterized protein n=1 Tax=Triparma retinervis TaxID=2557542 RepID=A0A9W6ZQN3_9STRA|nr:hypothetical protein TrRE_jg12172 [Triparma retinervis]
MIGDSPSNDVAYGKAAGCMTVLLDTGRSTLEGAGTGGADIVVGDLSELPTIIKSRFSDVPGLTAQPRPFPTTRAGLAALSGDVEELLKAVDNGGLNERCESGNTPLIWAAEGGSKEAVEILLGRGGGGTNERGYLGANAVVRAARRGELEVLKVLVGDERLKPSLDSPNDKGQSALHFAAFKRHPLCVRELLIAGADPRVRDRKGRTPDEDTDVEEIREGIRKFREAGGDPKILFG